jgi:hypothetical protein
MRYLLLIVAVTAMVLSAQDAPAPGRGRGGGPPKNLKVLKPEDVRASMAAATAGLGLMCTGCHVTGDFASDDKPQKLTARMMFEMTRDINSKFTDGKAHVSCYTCHRGQTAPLMAPPAAPAQ